MVAAIDAKHPRNLPPKQDHMHIKIWVRISQHLVGLTGKHHLCRGNADFAQMNDEVARQWCEADLRVQASIASNSSIMSLIMESPLSQNFGSDASRPKGASSSL